MTTAPILDLIAERAAGTPTGAYMRFGDRSVTWSELEDATVRVAAGLAQRGVGPGQRVALMLENSPEFLFAYFGTLAAGGSAVPVNVAQRGPTLAHILGDSGAGILIAEAGLKGVVAAVAPPEMQLVLNGTESFERLLRTDAHAPQLAEGQLTGPGIFYTSGTTGPPKGVVATGQYLSHVHALLSQLDVACGETVYTPLPLFHGNALILSAMAALWRGWTLALASRFSASRYWDDIRRYDAVATNALGAMIPILLKQPPRADDAINPLRTVLSAACPGWAWRQFEERFGVRLLEFYGLVDFPGYLLNSDNVPGSMGRPIGDTQFQVLDDDGNPAPAGSPGELVMRHPSGRPSYYHNDPEATETAYRGGWFHTGDLAIVGPDGDFRYAGRKKESMRRRGENISAWEIETVVNMHPWVRECAAHAVASPLGEDDVKLVVVRQPGTTLSPEDLLEYCADRMAAFAVPTYVEFRCALPKTATHRVRYELLKAEGITPETWHRPTARR